VVSYTALQRLCHCARGTIAAALDALQREGLLSRIKTPGAPCMAPGRHQAARQPRVTCSIRRATQSSMTSTVSLRVSVSRPAPSPTRA
jgi:DNA-binding GntR family transcriptional regulator